MEESSSFIGSVSMTVILLQHSTNERYTVFELQNETE